MGLWDLLSPFKDAAALSSLGKAVINYPTYISYIVLLYSCITCHKSRSAISVTGITFLHFHIWKPYCSKTKLWTCPLNVPCSSGLIRPNTTPCREVPLNQVIWMSSWAYGHHIVSDSGDYCRVVSPQESGSS